MEIYIQQVVLSVSYLICGLTVVIKHAAVIVVVLVFGIFILTWYLVVVLVFLVELFLLLVS